MSLRSSLGAWFYPPEVLLSEQFNFGHREVLVASNDFFADTLFLGSLQHGWCSPFDLRAPQALRNRKFTKFPMFVWSKRQEKDLVDFGFKHVIVIGSPWSHLLKACQVPFGKVNLSLAEQLSPNENNRSLLFFPRHSIPGGTANHRTDLKSLQEIAKVKSVTVCLFWLDFVNPEIRAFYSRFGCKIVCAGYRGSSGFETPWAPVGGRTMYLANILELISSHDVIATEETSTAFWYSISLGKEIVVLENTEEYLWWGDGRPQNIIVSNEKFLNSAGVVKNDLPLNRIIRPTPALLLAAKDELGFDYTHNIKLLDDKRYTARSNTLGLDLPIPVRDYIDYKLKQNSDCTQKL